MNKNETCALKKKKSAKENFSRCNGYTNYTCACNTSWRKSVQKKVTAHWMFWQIHNYLCTGLKCAIPSRNLRKELCFLKCSGFCS